MVDKDFYTLFVEQLGQEWDSVDVYSISACFGFYSQGMRIFSGVLSSMRKALTAPEPFKTREMRLLLVADDNPVDLFGVERFHRYLEPEGLKVRHLDKPSNLEEWIQFVVFRRKDSTQILHTRPQNGFRDDALELGINRLSPATQLNAEDDASRVADLVTLFETSWSSSRPFDFPRVPTLRELERTLEDRFPVHRRPGLKEEDHQRDLYVLLHGVCNPAAIHQQYQLGSDIFDLVIGDPKVRLMAIELKVASNNESELKRLKGQVETYRKVVRDVLLIIIGSGISRQKLGELRRWFEADEHVRILHVT